MVGHDHKGSHHQAPTPRTLTLACLRLPLTPRPRSRTRGISAAVTVALVAGLAVLGSATAASASTSYDVIATVPMGDGLGDGMGIDPVQHSLYISRPGANVVSVVDLTTNTVATTIPVNGPGRIAVDPIAHRAYVVSAGSLAVIDTTSNTVVDSIGGLSNPIGVAVDPSTHTVYVANYVSQTIVGDRHDDEPGDGREHRHRRKSPVGGGGRPDHPQGLCGHPLRRHPWRWSPGPASPTASAVSPARSRSRSTRSASVAYVVNNNYDGVSMIDTSTEQQRRHLQRRKRPLGHGGRPRDHHRLRHQPQRRHRLGDRPDRPLRHRHRPCR